MTTIAEETGKITDLRVTEIDGVAVDIRAQQGAGAIQVSADHDPQ